ncbi:hypothetical protein Pr1d_05410 [Bythopirellula goksoeyrii]|uniref:DUF4870 domain-containing protein n=1 Tax=Bythopirellula goksoeyrii TaxID=1400387 RepID=A0A5B9Q6G2_9BACT|nr:hypothetical protein Pr1d_05410 [Bythopirellula goksoeyrii]
MSTISNRIEGKFLVVEDKTALPMRCIRTNRSIGAEEYRHWDLPYIPKWLVIVMLISPFLLIIAPFVVRRRCRLKAGLSKSVGRNYLLLKFFGASLILFSFLGSLLGILLGSSDIVMFTLGFAPIFFWVGFAILILFASPLRVIRQDDDLFWVKGCSVTFLESLKESAN